MVNKSAISNFALVHLPYIEWVWKQKALYTINVLSCVKCIMIDVLSCIVSSSFYVKNHVSPNAKQAFSQYDLQFIYLFIFCYEAYPKPVFESSYSYTVLLWRELSSNFIFRHCLQCTHRVKSAQSPPPPPHFWKIWAFAFDQGRVY